MPRIEFQITCQGTDCGFSLNEACLLNVVEVLEMMGGWLDLGKKIPSVLEVLQAHHASMKQLEGDGNHNLFFVSGQIVPGAQEEAQQNVIGAASGASEAPYIYIKLV